MKHFLKSCAVLALFLPSTVFALNSQILRFYMPYSQGWSFVSALPKPAQTLTLGADLNYANEPLEFGNGSGRTGGIVNHLVTWDFSTAYSVTDRFAFSVNVPVSVSQHLTSLSSSAFETKMDMGDVMLSGLVNLISAESNNYGIGFAILPFVSLPTGISGDFVGDDNLSGGALFVTDVNLNGHYLGANLGMRFRQNESPIELRAGISKGFMQDVPLKASLVGGVGLGSGYGNPNYRAGIKIAYDRFLEKHEKPVVIEEPKAPTPQVRIQQIEKELKELTIYYPTNGSQVDPFYNQKISGIAEILKKNPDLGPLYIVGYTDDVGSDKYNQRLSERRGQTAAQSIMSNGLSSYLIVWVGLGEKYPIVPNTSDANRALNRRTFFTFLKPQQLMEKYSSKGVVGVNSVTGRQNDSYTEVLKELDAREKMSATKNTQVMRQYPDASVVSVDAEGDAKTKDSKGTNTYDVPNQARSKKYYETKTVIVTPPVTSDDSEAPVQKVKKTKSKNFSGKKKSSVIEQDLTDDTSAPKKSGDDVKFEDE